MNVKKKNSNIEFAILSKIFEYLSVQQLELNTNIELAILNLKFESLSQC